MEQDLVKDKTKVGIIAGLHAVRTALTHGAEQVHIIWHDQNRHDQRIVMLLKQANRLHVPTNAVDREALDALTQGANHQGIAAQTSAPAAWSEAALKGIIAELTKPAFLLILDCVQDPHNLGACLRTAEAAGVTAVIAPRDRSVGLTPSVCKIASGAVNQIPYVQVTNLARTLSFLKKQGIWLIGATGDASVSAYQADFKGPLAIILGGEDKGLRHLTREYCDFLVKLPMYGVVESLNVSVATGILLYEALRQRHTL